MCFTFSSKHLIKPRYIWGLYICHWVSETPFWWFKANWAPDSRAPDSRALDIRAPDSRAGDIRAGDIALNIDKTRPNKIFAPKSIKLALNINESCPSKYQ